MIGLTKRLCAMDGVSGFEDEVRDAIRAMAQPYAQEILEDAIGNLMVFRKGVRRPERSVMLCAHMDEVGLMVTHIADRGALKFDQMGGIDPRVLVGKRVKVGKDRRPGIIGFKPKHLLEPKEAKTALKMSDLYVDVGAADKASAEQLVSPGDICVFDEKIVEFGHGFLKAKAIDDRFGCALLLTLMEKTPPVDTWFVFTAQEETGTRGAFGAAWTISPDIALIVEGTTAADLPEAGHKAVCAAGGGVVIPFMDCGSVTDKELFDRMRGLCRTHDIPWQTKEYISGGTDAAAIQRSAVGVRTVGIAAPVRYIHSPSSVVKLSDCENMLRLAEAFLQSC